MSDFKDREPELPNHLKKNFDDATQRIEVIKKEFVDDETQRVEIIKEDIGQISSNKEETQKVGIVTDELLEKNAEVLDQKGEVKEEPKKEKKKKEKKTQTMKKIIIKRIIFLIIFAVIAVGVTLWLASQKSPEVKEKIEKITNTIIAKEEHKEVVNEKTVDINGKYRNNGVVFNYYEMDVLGRKVEYVQIDGLKDDAVEQKINNKIRERINTAATELFNAHQFTDYSVYIVEHANFANIISFTCEVSVAINDWSESYNEQLYFNYNLIDGNEVTIDDVFTSELELTNILMDGAYEVAVKEYTEFNDDIGEMYVSEKAPDTEEIVYAIVSDYQRGKLDYFYITPQKVSVIAGNWSVLNIEFKDYIDYLTIYDKYKTSTELYDGQVDRGVEQFNIYDIEIWNEKAIQYIDREGSNYYVNAVFYNDDGNEEVPEELMRTFENIFEEYLYEKEVRDSINRKDGTFRIYNFNVAFSRNYNGDGYYLRIHSDTYDTTKSKFDSVLKDVIREFFMEDKTDRVYEIKNIFLSELNYMRYETLNEYGYPNYIEYVDPEEIEYESAYIIFDNIGNIMEINGDSTILEIVD